MAESSVILGFLEKGERLGELKGARKVLLEVGEEAFGVASQHVREKIELLTNTDIIAKLARHVQQLQSWDELLAEVERLTPLD